MSERQTEPRVLRHIVFGFTVDCFPGAVILGYHQLKRMMERAGFDVKVTMNPLDALPPNVDLLFVPTELADASQRLASHCRVEVLQEMANHPIYRTLIQQLEEGSEWTAPRIIETTLEDGSKSVWYRGYERIE